MLKSSREGSGGPLMNGRTVLTGTGKRTRKVNRSRNPRITAVAGNGGSQKLAGNNRQIWRDER